eukprot:Hpha_TRINITY_DN13151_c0_g1::TRINITY_DN13151_c0_g1_i1::g.113699::m.113699
MAGLELWVECQGQTRPVELDPSATVGDLKRAAEKSFGVDGSTLNFQGEPLADESMPLADAGVCPESRVEMTLAEWRWEEDWGTPDIAGRAATIIVKSKNKFLAGNARLKPEVKAGEVREVYLQFGEFKPNGCRIGVVPTASTGFEVGVVGTEDAGIGVCASEEYNQYIIDELEGTTEKGKSFDWNSNQIVGVRLDLTQPGGKMFMCIAQHAGSWDKETESEVFTKVGMESKYPLHVVVAFYNGITKATVTIV